MCICYISGSGSLAAMSVFESRYKPDMEVNTKYSNIIMSCENACVFTYEQHNVFLL